MASSGPNSIIVLYKVINEESDKNDPMFNAFVMQRSDGKGVSLASVKQQCVALRGLNHLGADGYHWRVCMEDKPIPGEPAGDPPSFSWWDIQDENARLPVRQSTQSELNKFFSGSRNSDSYSPADSATKAAKGAFKQLGKAMLGTGSDPSSDYSGPPVSVIAFKLLDLVKLHDDFKPKGGVMQQPKRMSFTAPRAAPAPTPPQQRSAPAPTSQPRPHSQPPVRPQPPQPVPQQARAPPVAPRPQQEASLMDFAPAPAANVPRVPQRTMQHATSSPASLGNESRAKRLQREYAQKNQSSNRVWDDIDQRWVEVDGKSVVSQGTVSEPPGARGETSPDKKVMGISLDTANAVGKSATVQAAVHQRVADMRSSQQKALQEVREREERKKLEESEEDIVRKKLEPRIKAWSEDHGKKKQLRALLGTLHTILWPEAGWKPVSIGDILDDAKVKRCFHKASRVVHPDKVHHLDAEKRFLAKRIFDALSQAKNEFENGAK